VNAIAEWRSAWNGFPTHYRLPVCVADLPCLTEFVHKSRHIRIERFRANNADIYDRAQVRALRSITKARLPKSARHSRLVTVAAILEDKARLIRGQATSINVQALLEVAELIRRRRDERDAGG